MLGVMLHFALERRSPQDWTAGGTDPTVESWEERKDKFEMLNEGGRERKICWELELRQNFEDAKDWTPASRRNVIPNQRGCGGGQVGGSWRICQDKEGGLWTGT